LRTIISQSSVIVMSCVLKLVETYYIKILFAQIELVR